MTVVDFNPFPLGKIAPTSGTPLKVNDNFTDLQYPKCQLITVYSYADNAGRVYIGRSDMDRSTMVGVIAILEPGETRAIPYVEFGSNKLDLGEYYVDVDTTGDWALPTALFA